MRHRATVTSPEKLLLPLTLQVLYGRLCERLLTEQLDYNLLFRWFAGLSIRERGDSGTLREVRFLGLDT